MALLAVRAHELVTTRINEFDGSCALLHLLHANPVPAERSADLAPVFAVKQGAVFEPRHAMAAIRNRDQRIDAVGHFGQACFETELTGNPDMRALYPRTVRGCGAGLGNRTSQPVSCSDAHEPSPCPKTTAND